jgi:hypothetical protein
VDARLVAGGGLRGREARLLDFRDVRYGGAREGWFCRGRCGDDVLLVRRL